MDGKRSWWGWGYTDQALGDTERAGLAGMLADRFPGHEFTDHRPPEVHELDLPPVRIAPPAALARLCSADPRERAAHTHGKAFRDVVRNLQGDLRNAPDLVAYPAGEADIADLMDWCATEGIALIPFGGGTSVVGGIEPRLDTGHRGVVTLDLTRLDRVTEIDLTSRAARVQAGVLGPHLEDQLRPHGMSLRHYPQSFEFSTLGGWIATRAGGHFATLYTHIDDLVESLRVVTPAGTGESLRLPGSGAGPSPDRLFLGSEGILGVITEAWVRLQDRPRWRSGASVHFAHHDSGVAAARAIAQAGLYPANCRLLDATEAALTAGVQVGGALLVLAFESADHPVAAWLDRAVDICRHHGGTLPEGPRHSDAAAHGGAAGREGAAGAWREAFLRMPYVRDAMVRLGCIAETFETACTWDRFEALRAGVVEAAGAALAEVCGGGTITCRFTHVYPDGPAPYFTVYAPGRWGEMVEQWDQVKVAVSGALAANGATITHHHAVGRDHRPWYDGQRPDPFAAALGAAKGALDPAGILNPGVLLPALRRDGSASVPGSASLSR